MTETTAADVVVRPAVPGDRSTVDRLWLMFRHDLSEFRGLLPGPDGSFRGERVEDAFAAPGWAPYLFVRGGRPVGFAFVRALDAPVRVLNSFFVVRGARRTGVGLAAVREVLARHPGRWEIAFQYENPGAVAFWRRVAAEAADGAWTEETRPVPGMPELPPDVWISFGTAP
ncbi:GNAT family N-acetyltransferase [Streptomyces sp. Ag109_O5-10]|uniref:GNAT family N-acetyltransferase n=1 Tax=Streptomyces sp. Ag109_O5-10 TaxID=1855349 RepID=UPI00089DA43B|nr:GNAT family N-acetyltransferase [Streptomyces sp. Ag109_O5-10]SED80080.1 Predicted acetyltransferase [Streptomyces sp. Ag109_O5-10]